MGHRLGGITMGLIKLVFIDGENEASSNNLLGKTNKISEELNLYFGGYTIHNDLMILHNLNSQKISQILHKYDNCDVDAVKIFITNDITTFSYATSVPLRDKYYYSEIFGEMIPIIGCMKKVPKDIHEDTLLKMYMNGELSADFIGKGVVAQIADRLRDVISDDVFIYSTFGVNYYSVIAQALFKVGIRPTKEKGLVIVEGEASVVPPELIQKIKDLMN